MVGNVSETRLESISSCGEASHGNPDDGWSMTENAFAFVEEI